MTGRTPVSIARGVAAGLVAILLVAAGSAPSGAQASGPTIELVDRSPWVDIGGTLTVDLAVDDTVETVEVRVHGRLDSAEELADSRTDDEGPVLFAGFFPVSDLTPVTEGVARLQLDISDTVNEGSTIRMAFAGVYPVVITPVDADGAAGDSIRTPVVRRSGAGSDLTGPDITVAVDLSSSPTATDVGDRRPFGTAELARFGRLADLLGRAGPDAPIAVLASADTVAGLAASDDAAAAALLLALATPGVVVVPQPTVPVDWTALVAAGLGDLIPGLITDGQETIAAALGDAATIDDSTSDARGGIDVDTLDTVAAAGHDRVLVSSTRLRLGDDGSVDPAVAVPMTVDVTDAPEGLDVLAVDDVTSQALMARSDGAHTTLADLVLRAPEPDTAILVVIDDLPSGSALDAGFELLTTTGTPARLAAFATPSGEATAEPTTVTLLPPEGADIDDIRDLAGRIRTAAASVATYTRTVGADSPGAEGARSLLSGSLQRGLPRSERTRLLDHVDTLTAATFDGLGFTGPAKLNLTSRSGTLPIGIRNDTGATVTVVLSAQSDRLDFPAGDDITLELAPGETRVDLSVEALASGSVPLFVQLRSADGTTTFDSRQLDVRSTAVSGVGLILSAGALVVLLAWWFRTWRAHRRAGTRVAHAAPPGDDGTA